MSKSNITVTITDCHQIQEIRLSKARFLEDQTTLIPVSFIPKSTLNYTIDISPSDFDDFIRRKWSDYADGFTYDGAIFTCEDNGGKKIRRGDSISTHKSYYLMSRSK